MIRSLPRARAAAALALVASLAQGVSAQSLLRRLAGLLGLPSAPTQLRGEDPNVSGDIWVIPAAGGTKTRVTTDGGYRSPVFSADGRTLFALRGDTLVRVGINDHAVHEVAPARGVARLAGVAPDRPNDLVLIASDGARRHLETLDVASLRRTVVPHDPNDAEDSVVLAYLASDARDYGSVRLAVEDQNTSVRTWKDVFVQTGSQPRVNLTNGNGVSSRQPALSPDRTLVAYVNVGRIR